MTNNVCFVNNKQKTTININWLYAGNAKKEGRVFSDIYNKQPLNVVSLITRI